MHKHVAVAFAHIVAYDAVSLQRHEHLGGRIFVDLEFIHQEFQIDYIDTDDDFGNIAERDRLVRVTTLFHRGNGRLDVALSCLSLRFLELTNQVLQRTRRTRGFFSPVFVAFLVVFNIFTPVYGRRNLLLLSTVRRNLLDDDIKNPDTDENE